MRHWCAVLATLAVVADWSASWAQDSTSRRKDAPYAAASTSAGQLVDESREAFLRSLLPLSDHLEHLSVIYEAQGRAAYDSIARQTRGSYETNRSQPDAKQLEKAFRPVFQTRLDALQEAAQRLENFRQPASTGWEADVALARVALAQAQLDQAKFLGKKTAVIELTETEQQLAADHYWKRLSDARVGQASMPALVQAVALMNVAPEFRRDTLKDAADKTVIWADRGAGIGRKDAVTRAELDLAWLDGYRQRKDGSLKVNDAAWRESDQFAERLFEQRLEFLPKGTATLGDLSRTWMLRQQMHEIARDAQYKMPKGSIDQHDQNLKVLQDAAQATTDRRGRHAADVTFVTLLADLRTAEKELEAR